MIQINQQDSQVAKAWVPFAEESFLVTLANKGLYKRAQKDFAALENCTIESISEGLKVSWDDIVVQLRQNVAESQCSCPSKTICKHILMAVLATAQAADKNAIQEEEHQPQPEQVQEDYQQLKEAQLSELKKKAGKRLFEDSLHLIQQGITAQLTEGEMLTATIETEQTSVCFPKQNSIQNAVCKCGATGLCRHKLIGILSYLKQHQLLLIPDEEQVFAGLSESLIELIKLADLFLVSVMEKGISRCGENDIEMAIQLSLKFEAEGIGNLSHMMRTFSTDIEHLNAKHVAFHPMETFALISRMHNTLSLVLKNTHNAEMLSMLLENSRSDYQSIPQVQMIGLGAYPWQTRSGYVGVTAICYCQEKEQFCTYSMSMADYYENTQNKLELRQLETKMKQPIHWAEDISLLVIAKNCFCLKNGKFNAQNRISSSKQTSCLVQKQTMIEDLQQITSATFSAQAEEYSYFVNRKPEEVYILPVEQITDVVFDNVLQELTFEVVTQQQERLPASIPHQKHTEQAIVFLERLSKKSKKTPFWFVARKRNQTLLPISLIDNTGVVNFYFHS